LEWGHQYATFVKNPLFGMWNVWYAGLALIMKIIDHETSPFKKEGHSNDEVPGKTNRCSET